MRKEFSKLKPTDAALVATALVEAGRMAKAVHDGEEYEWTPENYEPFTKSILREVEQIAVAMQEEKKKAADEEPITMTVQLKPSQAAGEEFLGPRDDLKTKLSDILEEGVEYLYSPTDLGWHWTLERVNWGTVSGGTIKSRVMFNAEFVDGSVAVLLGPGGKRRVKKTKKK